MKIWKILSPKVLTAEERPDSLTEETQARVKVMQLMLSGSDVRSYSGSLRPKYPVVPGMFAVGVVSEAGAGCVQLEKGTRVYIHDAMPCEKCDRCLSGDEENCSDLHTAGVNAEGFLRDFVTADEGCFSPLPPSVSNDEALFVGVVSACEAVIDRLDVPKGTHVAVLGAGIFGNVLSQLLIYHQAVPILIDSSEKLLSIASQCGIYYTVKADEELEAAIERITGGRFAAASVYCSYCGLPAELPFSLTAHAGKVIYAGFGFPEVQTQLKAALDKRLTLSAVSNDPSNYAGAINLLVNKAVNIAPFHIRRYAAEDLKTAFEERAEAMEKGSGEGPAVINLLS